MTAFQHLLNAKIETIKLQHAEKINLLLNEWEVNKSKALEDLRLAYDKRINDLEKHYHDLQRQIKEEEAQMYSQKLATELQRQHVCLLLSLLYFILCNSVIHRRK